MADTELNSSLQILFVATKKNEKAGNQRAKLSHPPTSEMVKMA